MPLIVILDLGFNVFDLKSGMPLMSIRQTDSAKSNGGSATLSGTDSVIE